MISPSIYDKYHDFEITKKSLAGLDGNELVELQSYLTHIGDRKGLPAVAKEIKRRS